MIPIRKGEIMAKKRFKLNETTLKPKLNETTLNLTAKALPTITFTAAHTGTAVTFTVVPENLPPNIRQIVDTAPAPDADQDSHTDDESLESGISQTMQDLKLAIKKHICEKVEDHFPAKDQKD